MRTPGDVLDPRLVVTLLSVSIPFLAVSQFVYGLKVLEIIGGILLIAGLWVWYVALITLALFAGTLTIFVIAPGVTGSDASILWIRSQSFRCFPCHFRSWHLVGFAYVLGGVEVIAGVLLLNGHWTRYVALLPLALFACIRRNHVGCVRCGQPGMVACQVAVACLPVGGLLVDSLISKVSPTGRTKTSPQVATWPLNGA